jgi:hypothetical protein
MVRIQVIGRTGASVEIFGRRILRQPTYIEAVRLANNGIVLRGLGRNLPASVIKPTALGTAMPRRVKLA